MKKSVLVSFLSFGTALLVPIAAFAQLAGTPNTSYVDFWIDTATSWLSKALTVIMVLMTLFFLWGVFRYIAEKDPGKLADKRKTMMSGLIGLFIAVSVWGIVNIAGNVFGTKNAPTPQVTCPPGTIASPSGCRIPRTP